MSDEARESQATAKPAKQAGEAADENQNRLATQEEQITKPAPKVKPQREKDPKKVAAGKKLAEKNRPPKIEASCFCFLRSGDSDEISLRPPPYNPSYAF